MAGIRVLIVDDVAQVRRDLRALLHLAGGLEIVGEAADGLEAVSQAVATRPEVILMDLEMPGMDGFEATRRIKARYPSCRVIALTVHGYAASRQRAAEAGADDFIVKGARAETLLRAISGRED